MRATYPPDSGTVSSSRLDRGLPSSVQMAPFASQFEVAGRVTTAFASESGVTVISHRMLPGGSSRRAWTTEPPVTVNARSRSVSWLMGNSSLNRNSKVAVPLRRHPGDGHRVGPRPGSVGRCDHHADHVGADCEVDLANGDGVVLVGSNDIGREQVGDLRVARSSR